MSPPTKPATTIDDLPAELISELFRHLNLNDLVACSTVNKRWHSIYSDFKLKTLIVGRYIDGFHGEEMIKEKKCQLRMLSRLMNKPVLSDLKHLSLCFHLTDFDLNQLNQLNQFGQLQRLEIEILGCAPRDRPKVNLNLPKLKFLALRKINPFCTPSIDSPALKTLIYKIRGYGDSDFRNLDIKNPETIKNLRTNLEDRHLVRFRNVERLEVSDFNLITKDILLALPELKELRCNLNQFYLDEKTFARTKPKLKKFLNDLNESKVPDFQFIFAGFRMTKTLLEQIEFDASADEHNNYRYSLFSSEYICLKNCHLIEPGALHFFNSLDYTRLMKYVVEEIPSCFFKMFTGPLTIRAFDLVQDEDHLLSFLGSLSTLRFLELNLDFSTISQAFFEQLPASASTLVILNLRQTIKTRFRRMSEAKQKVLHCNFGFVQKFTRLSSFSVTADLSFESLDSLFESLKKLKSSSNFHFACITTTVKKKN